MSHYTVYGIYDYVPIRNCKQDFTLRKIKIYVVFILVDYNNALQLIILFYTYEFVR